MKGGREAGTKGGKKRFRKERKEGEWTKGREEKQ